MHVSVKKLVLAGVCLAISMIIILLESVFGMSTLFLLGLSGCLIGIIIRELGLKVGFIYLLASIPLALFIAPDKVKTITYIVVEIYIFLREFAWERLSKNTGQDIKAFRIKNYLIRWLIFNILLIPLVFVFPELFLARVTLGLQAVIILVLQATWLIVDTAYNIFQEDIWGRLRGRFRGSL